MLFFRLAFQDGVAGFRFRGADGDSQPRAEAGFQAGFQAFDFFRVAVAGEDDLPLLVYQLIESVEKFGLRLVFAAEKLHVVHQQGIDVA